MALKPDIELHIEELVLHGFSPSARHSIADAIRNELASRLAVEGLPHARDVSIERVDAGQVNVSDVGAAVFDAIGGADVPSRGGQ